MKQYTKDNPGCIHDMLRYLSELSGIPTIETVQLPYNQVFKANNEGKRIALYPSYNIDFVVNGKSVGYLHKQMRKGNVPVLTNDTDDFPYDVDIDHFIVTRRRKTEDFGISITKLNEKYKDSLGGGWYSMVELYQVNDQFFANMECTC